MGGEELRFTGNWFIDAGILGFVNLMEEVYRWDLEELQKRIKEEPEKVYYGYFPLAYMFRRSIVSGIYKQQRELRSLVKKAIEKKQKLKEQIAKKEERLKTEKSLKKIQNIQNDIKKLEQQINELDKLMFKVNEYMSLLDRELPNLKDEFRKRVERVLESYETFEDQYRNYFIEAEWVYTILPKDRTSELNKKLEKILDHAVELKLLTKSEKKNDVERILRMLPDNECFVIHANANERNFYLYNPPKEDEYTVLMYITTLLHEDIEKIKLLLGIKYEQKKPQSLKNRISNFLELCKRNNLDPDRILNNIEDAINNGLSKKKAIDSVLKNYEIHDSSKEEFKRNLSDIYRNFKDLISRRGQLITYEVVPDSTINPFLFSPGEFPNVSYTSLPKIEDIKKILPTGFPPYGLFLTFFDAFFPVYGNGVMFYTPELGSCYSINKRIRTKVELAKEDNRGRLLKITWSAIIDELVETKSKFSLENMYLIEANVDKNKLSHVEYIGIPKLHASILLDDTIRDALNTSIGIGDSWKWLLEEFLKQKPLYPLIQMHLWFAIKTGSTANSRTLLYALAVDAKLKEQAKCRLIFKPVFESPDRVVQDIQEFYERMNLARLNISRALGEEGKRYIHPLFSALRKHNRNAFMNIFLKALTHAKEKETVKYLTSYLINRILLNDSAWEDFALALLVGLVGGGSYASSGGESSED